MTHVGEPGTDPVVVSTDQWVGYKVYMVPDDHNVAYMEIGIHSTGGI